MTGRILPNADIIEVRQGDSFNIKLRFKAKNKALDVSKLKVLMQVRKTENDSLVFEKEAESVEAAQGIYLLRLTPVETSAPVGSYKTDIQVTFANGETNTIFPQSVAKVGVFRLTPQVTK